jgi:carbohydrate kinase (thermoresistant glucokinase family)
MVIVIGGVAGAGQSTIARAFAQRVQFHFFAGDEFHSPENAAKVQAGVPLNDADREPWVLALSDLIGDLLAAGVDAVVTCSALRESERELLARDGVKFVSFWVPAESGCANVETVTESANAFTVDANRAIEDVVEEILRLLRLGVPQ